MPKKISKWTMKTFRRHFQNINLPGEATCQHILQVFIEAWKMRPKSVAVCHKCFNCRTTSGCS